MGRARFAASTPLYRAIPRRFLGQGLSPLELGNEEDFAAFTDRLEIGGLVKGAVDRDGGFLFEMLTEAGVEAVHRLDDAAQVPGLDRKFTHAAGVAAAETGREHNPRGHWLDPS